MRRLAVILRRILRMLSLKLVNVLRRVIIVGLFMRWLLFAGFLRLMRSWRVMRLFLISLMMKSVGILFLRICILRSVVMFLLIRVMVRVRIRYILLFGIRF